MADESLPIQSPGGDCWASKKPQPPGAADANAPAGSSAGRGARIANVGTILSAIMASSCCWLPPILIVMGVSGAGMTKALETYRPYFMVVTFGFLGAAFYMTYRPRRTAQGAEDCCAPAAAGSGWRFNMMTMNKIMLWAVTVMAVVFLFFPQYVTGLFAADGEITADMHQTVIRIEGMTCPGWELKAETAIRTAPGVLAVKADYEAGQATIGSEKGQPLSESEVMAALESIGYRGQIVTQPD